MHESVEKLDSVVACFSFQDEMAGKTIRLVSVSERVLRLRRGRPKRSRRCDFLEVLRFLNLFQRKAKSVYQVYHSSLRFDLKKVYRYLRYCLAINLIEIDYVAEKGFLPAKYYRLTEKGRALTELFKDLRIS